MKRYRILHQTSYEFSSSVQLQPHTLRLRPREGHEMHIESSALNIEPSAMLRWHRDSEGNSVAVASFSSPSNRLFIESDITIQQYNQAPLDFMVTDYAQYFPFAYLPEDNIMLQPYLSVAGDSVNSEMSSWMSTLWHPGETIQTYSLLERLNQRVHEALNYQMREEPGVQSAEQSLYRRAGSCRDSANLFMESARRLGFASRFVSGYIYAPNAAATPGSTHAWAEIFLPGAGWKGFDPTTGRIVGSEHIAVAVARQPESVPPVEGSYFGNAGATMQVGVWVNELLA